MKKPPYNTMVAPNGMLSPKAKALTYFIPRVHQILLNQEEAKARSLNYERPRLFGSKTNILYETMDEFCALYGFDLLTQLHIEKETRAILESNITLHKRVHLSGEHESEFPVILKERLLIILFEKESIQIGKEMERSGIKKPYCVITQKGTPSNFAKLFAVKLARRFVSSVIFIGDRDAEGINSYKKCRELIPEITYIKINDLFFNPETLRKYTKNQDSLLNGIIASSSSPQFIIDLAKDIQEGKNPLHLDNNYQLVKHLVALISETDFVQYKGGYCDLNIRK
ncbi:hypothetical protein I9W82_002207 [Candida metapsilosis]|uniref:Uncharacterized protein n=1 Tax=Candida metapsilosis TaxID=273372 RepID=A0A8H7ZHY2_9ASCO|nr:hypothetical protein I9W82_002207 [Candida metapsilosis]